EKGRARVYIRTTPHLKLSNFWKCSGSRGRDQCVRRARSGSMRSPYDTPVAPRRSAGGSPEPARWLSGPNLNPERFASVVSLDGKTGLHAGAKLERELRHRPYSASEALRRLPAPYQTVSARRTTARDEVR